MKTKKLFLVVFAFVLIFCLSACSKASKKDTNFNGNVNTESDESRSPVSSNSDTSGNNKNEGIKITVINITKNELVSDSISCYLYSEDGYKEKIDNGYTGIPSIAWALGSFSKGKAELYLKEPDYPYTPWTTTGEYYIQFDPDIQIKYFYTDGKTLEQLGIRTGRGGLPILEELYKLPKFNLKITGNTIDYTKQVLPVYNETDYGFGN